MNESDLKRRLVRMADGTLVERDVLNIVEKIRAYDPNLRVKYCDPSRAEFGDAPYRITEICKDGIERQVFSVWELNDLVLERLYQADSQRLDIIGAIDLANYKADLAQKQRYRESIDEAHDIVQHYLKNSKTTFSFVNDEGEKVIIDDQEGRTHKKGVNKSHVSL